MLGLSIFSESLINFAKNEIKLKKNIYMTKSIKTKSTNDSQNFEKYNNLYFSFINIFFIFLQDEK